MASQLELRLLHAIAGAGQQELRAINQTKLACYLARVGEFKRAEDIRLQIRSIFGDGRSPSVSILLMLLDGLLVYYRDLGLAARDRIARANLISLATRSNELIPLTFAWLAHIDFNQGDYVAMAREIRLCLDRIQDDAEDVALIRIALVLGDAFLYCGCTQDSRVWYEKARLAATTQGDQAAIGAMIYNKAALNVQNLRIAAAHRELSESEVGFANGEIQSAINYQKLATMKSLDHLLVAANVGAKMLKKDFQAARSIGCDLMSSEDFLEGTNAHLLLQSDLALCDAMLGDFGLAEGAGLKIMLHDLERLEADDRIIVFCNLQALFTAVKNHERCAEAALGMTASINEFTDRKNGLVALLSEFSAS